MATTDRTVKGFNIGGDTYKYDFEALVNRPEDFGNKNVVMIQNERPVESGNRVWVKETAAEIEIPTSSEFEELRENIVVVSSDTPTSDDNRIWIEPETGKIKYKKQDGTYAGFNAITNEYRQGAGEPSSVVPNWIGEEYFDTSAEDWYKAVGTSAGDWKKITA